MPFKRTNINQYLFYQSFKYRILNNNYNEKEDQLRVTVKQKASDSNTESLVYTINKKSIVLSWEKWNIPFSVK